MVTIKTYNNAGEAGFAQSQLESAGIRALVADEYSYTVGYPIGGIRLQVPEADADTARRMLDCQEGFVPLPEDFEPPVEPATSTTNSPNPSQSGRIATLIQGGVLTVLSFGLLALLAPQFGIRIHANLGGVALLFVLGGIVGIIIRAIYQKGRKDASRSQT
jgi:hypothetical protein